MIKFEAFSWQLIDFYGEMVFIEGGIFIYTGEKPRIPITHENGSTLHGTFMICAFSNPGAIQIERAES